MNELKRGFCLMLASLLAAAVPARADDAFEFFKEEAQVVTASRRAEPAWRAPVAVDVVTAEDIKAYGFKQIWDALRYRAGMDVSDGTTSEGNRAIVSARGFGRDFVTEMQVLVDGRSVYSPFLGGVYWDSLPVPMEDIERIEIVRGPNAVLYGSNAGLGVINIITKKPDGTNAAGVAAWGGNRDQVGTSENAQGGGPLGGLRVSHEYRAEDGHPNANGVGDGNDFLHVNRLNVRADVKPAKALDLEAFGGGSWLTSGLPGIPGTPPQSQNTNGFGGLKATRSLDGGGAIEFSASRADTTIDILPLFAGNVAVRTVQTDFEALHRFSWLDDRVQTNWGGSWRKSTVYSDQTFAGNPIQQNRLVRGFMHHSVKLLDPLTFVGGLSVEHSGTGGLQSAWQAAFLYEPVAEQTFRVSYSLAPTIPPLFPETGNYMQAPGKRFMGNASLMPEKLESWETGWNGRLLGGALRPGITLYYMTIRQQDFDFVKSVQAAPTLTTFSVDNRNKSIARGAELSAEYTLSRGRVLFANYTYERITAAQGPDPFGNDPRTATPQHKFNVGGRAALPKGFTVSSIIGYKDSYQVASPSRGNIVPIHRSFLLTARAAWAPRPGWELFAAGENLLQPYTVEYADGVASPREIRGGVEWKFF